MRSTSVAPRIFVVLGVICIGNLWLMAQSSQPASNPGTPAQSLTSVPAAPSAPPVEKPILILIDPAHGGSDAGALITPTAAEKDINLNMARRLKQELSARGIQAQLVRDGDATLSADQRAANANGANPALYIALHASSLGTGMTVFTSMLPSVGDSKGPFVAWDTAQSAALDRSKTLQTQLITAIQLTHFPIRALIAPLRPLNNIKSPAIAIEVSPTAGSATQVASTGYQQMVCAVVANALLSLAPAMRASAGARP